MEADVRSVEPVKADLVMIGSMEHLDKEDIRELKTIRFGLVVRFSSEEDARRIMNGVSIVVRWPESQGILA